MLLELLVASQVKEEDEDYMSTMDYLFEDLKMRDPDHFAVRQYEKFKLAAGKTAKSILISCGARLAPFDIKELREIMEYDELELDTLGDRKTALFLIMSDTDATFNFLISMIYTGSPVLCIIIHPPDFTFTFHGLCQRTCFICKCSRRK
jgi:type IV secretion system protein VirD4